MVKKHLAHIANDEDFECFIDWLRRPNTAEILQVHWLP